MPICRCLRNCFRSGFVSCLHVQSAQKLAAWVEGKGPGADRGKNHRCNAFQLGALMTTRRSLPPSESHTRKLGLNLDVRRSATSSLCQRHGRFVSDNRFPRIA